MNRSVRSSIWGTLLWWGSLQEERSRMPWIRSSCKPRLSELVQWYTRCCSAGNVSIVVHDDIVFMFLDAPRRPEDRESRCVSHHWQCTWSRPDDGAVTATDVRLYLWHWFWMTSYHRLGCDKEMMVHMKQYWVHRDRYSIVNESSIIPRSSKGRIDRLKPR